MKKISHLLITTLVCVAAVSLIAGERRPITFEDFFSLKRLGNIAANSQGTLIAYDVKIPDIENNTFKTDIWLLDVTTGKSRQFTNHPESSTGPVWSPDGLFIYFNRDGQIWKQSIHGGEARPVTSYATGASGPVFNKNGTQMLFVSDVYPDCETEACNRQKLEAAENNPVKARIIDKLFYRHWNRWLEGRRSHVFLANSDGKVLRDLTPGDYDTPPLDLGSSHDYTFSANGKEVCVVRNTDKIVAASTNNDLFTIDLNGEKMQRLTTSPANDNHPVYSPDGRYLAYRAMKRPGFEADKYDIMLYDLKGKTTRNLTESCPYSASSLIWHPGSKDIFFTATAQGNINLYRVNIENSRCQSVLSGHYLHEVSFLNKNELIMANESAASPREIFKYNLKDKSFIQLSNINSEFLTNLELPRYESFWFTGAKGDSVQGFLLKPPGFKEGQTYPAIELIHGGPQGGWGDDFHYRWNYQMFAAPGYVVFMINFHGSRGYGQEFTDAVSKDWGGAPYEDIIEGTQFVLEKYPFIDRDHLGAAGASYGGFMVNWIAGGEHPFKCLVSHDGVYEQVSMYGATEELWFPEWEFNGLPWEKESLYQKWNPANRAGNFKTPTLVIHGEQDYRVPYTQGLQMFTALQRQGVKSRLLFFPDEDHFVTKPQNARLWWKTVHGWFAEFLNP